MAPGMQFRSSPSLCNPPGLCLNAKPTAPAPRPEPQTSNSKAQRSWLASPRTAATSSKHQRRRGHLQKPVTRKPRRSFRRMRPIEVSSGNSSVLSSTSISWKEFRVFRRKRRWSKAGTSVPLNLTWLGTASQARNKSLKPCESLGSSHNHRTS